MTSLISHSAAAAAAAFATKHYCEAFFERALEKYHASTSFEGFVKLMECSVTDPDIQDIYKKIKGARNNQEAEQINPHRCNQDSQEQESAAPALPLPVPVALGAEMIRSSNDELRIRGFAIQYNIAELKGWDFKNPLMNFNSFVRTKLLPILLRVHGSSAYKFSYSSLNIIPELTRTEQNFSNQIAYLLLVVKIIELLAIPANL